MFRSRAEAASHLKFAFTCSHRGELGWLERALQSLFLGKELYATEGKIGRCQGLGHSQKKVNKRVRWEVGSARCWAGYGPGLGARPCVPEGFLGGKSASCLGRCDSALIPSVIPGKPVDPSAPSRQREESPPRDTQGCCLGAGLAAGQPEQELTSLLIHDGTALARALPYETHWKSIPHAGMVEQLDSFTQRNNEVEKVTGPLVGEELEATPWRSIWSWMIYPKAEDTGGYEGPGLGHASLRSTAKALLHHRCIQEHQVLHGKTEAVPEHPQRWT
nr:uncharacterized protein LOC125182623 isoform X2 [Anser cygnoides]